MLVANAIAASAMANWSKLLTSFLVPIALASLVFWAAKDERTVVITEVINHVPDMQYCYTSEDGDWLICRMKEK